MTVGTHAVVKRTRRPRLPVALCAWLILCCASTAIAQDLVTLGPVMDGRPSALQRENGDVLIAFEREDMIDGTLYQRIFFTVSLDGGRTFLTPVPFRTSAASDREPTLIETETGLVYLYYTSDQSGMDRIWAANSFTATEWNIFVSPLALVGGVEPPVGRPAAALSPDGPAGAYLAFENRLTGRVMVERLDGFLTPTSPVNLDRGVEPSLRLLGDTLTLAWRDGLDIRAAARVLLSMWTDPFTAFGGLPFRDPNLALLPNDTLALFVGLDIGPTQRVMRALSIGPTAPPLFAQPELIPAGDFNIVQPFALADDPSNPGRMGVYVSLLEEDGTAHLMRAGMGACDEPPNFSGVFSVVDEDPCTDSGLLVSWDEPIDWGSASDGEYELHRFETPGTSLDAATLVWRGPELSHVDVPPLAGQPYLYAVLAIGSEACVDEWRGTVGLVSGMAMSLEGIDFAGGLEPDEVKGLRLSKTTGTQLRFEWSSNMTAESYVIGSSPTPQEPLRSGFLAIGSPTTADWLELTPAAVPVSYYAVWAISPCGVEGSP